MSRSHQIDPEEASEQVAAIVRILKMARPEDHIVILGVYLSKNGSDKAIKRFLSLNQFSKMPSNYSLETTGGKGATEGIYHMLYLRISGDES